MSLEWSEQLHGFFIKERVCFGTANLSFSHSAFGRRYGFDLIAAVDTSLAALVAKRVDDHFEFAVTIEIKHCGDLVHVWSTRLIRVDLPGHKSRLNFADN